MNSKLSLVVSRCTFLHFKIYMHVRVFYKYGTKLVHLRFYFPYDSETFDHFSEVTWVLNITH